MKVKFSQRDIKSSKIVTTPNWYLCRLTKYDERPNGKDPQIINISIGGEIVAPEESAGIQFYGYLCQVKPDGEIPYAQYSAIPFVAALIGKDRSDITPDEFADLSEATVVGQELDVYLQSGMYNDKPQNQFKDFAPAGRFTS